MRMPMAGDYVAALQHPHRCFRDPQLINATPEKNRMGLPRPFTGKFAVIFHMRLHRTRWRSSAFSTTYLTFSTGIERSVNIL